MNIYLILYVLLVLANLLLCWGIFAYCGYTKANALASQEELSISIPIKIVADALFFVVIGSILVFGGIPIFGSTLNALLKALGWNELISFKDGFLINLMVFNAHMGLVIRNKLSSLYHNQIKSISTRLKEIDEKASS